ncbi:MAG: hypothetical protein KAG84_05290 [Bacteroidales bacterium]|nr:hypothetical protein [Bacteroidales bacterium]
MIKNIFLFIIGLLLSLGIFAQEKSKNNVFAELSGVTSVYSINYERLRRNDHNVIFSFRIGFAYFPTKLITDTYVGLFYNSRFTFPMSISLLKNIGHNNFLELRIAASNAIYRFDDYKGRGLGDSTNNFVAPTKTGFNFYPSIGIGYRYQPLNKGIFINALYQQVLYLSEDNWFGNISLGIGYSF